MRMCDVGQEKGSTSVELAKRTEIFACSLSLSPHLMGFVLLQRNPSEIQAPFLLPSPLSPPHLCHLRIPCTGEELRLYATDRSNRDVAHLDNVVRTH